MAVRAALGADEAGCSGNSPVKTFFCRWPAAWPGRCLRTSGLEALLSLAPVDLPRSDGISINGTVLAFSFGMCLLTGVVFGLLPASTVMEKDPQAGLHEGGRGASAGPGVHRARGLLIAAQFALAIVLLTGAGLLIRSFLLLNAVRPGFDTSHLLTMTVPLAFERYAEQARSRAFYEEAIRRVEALPGVRGAALGSAVFGSFQDHVPNQNLVIEGRPFTQNVKRHGRDIVSDNYFQVMGIPLRDGRLFSCGRCF